MLPQLFDDIQQLIIDRRLQQALDSAHRLIDNYPALYPCNEQLREIQLQLQLMTDALVNGYEDKQRNTFYTQLLHQLDSHLRNMRMLWYRHYEPSIVGYWAQAKAISGDGEVIRQQLEQYVATQTVKQLQSTAQTEGTDETDVSEHFRWLNNLFLRLWLSEQWRSQDEEQFTTLLLSPTIESFHVCIIISAITLSLLTVYDERKISTLAKVYHTSTDEQIRQRALVGWLLGENKCSDPLHDGISMEVDDDTRREMLEMQMQLFYCLTTEEDNQTIQRDIIPTLLKNSPIAIQNGTLIEKEEDDDINDILNPHAEEEKMEEMENSMRKMMNMQNEGVDVFFSGFSRMKHFPFFHNLAAWFMPFTLQHPALHNILVKEERSRQLIQALLNRGPFCDSDKYSFAFVLDQTINNIPDNLMEALATADVEMEEHFALERNNPSFVRRMYLQNLFRFFQLHRDRALFHTPLSPEAVKDTVKALLASSAMMIKPLASFLYRRKHYDALLHLVESTSFENDEEVQLLYALALQKKGLFDESEKPLRYVLDHQPQSTRAQSALARVLLQKEAYEEARKWYEQLHQYRPESIAYALRLALCMIETDDEEEALKVVYEQHFAHPDDAEVKRMLGWTLLRCGRAQQAQQLFETNKNERQAVTDALYLAYSLWIQGKRENTIEVLVSFLSETDMSDSNDRRQRLEELFTNDAKLLKRNGIDTVERQLIIDETIRRSG